MNNRLVRNGFMYLVLAVAILVVLFVMFNPGQPNQQTVPISELLSRVEAAADSGSQPEIMVSANAHRGQSRRRHHQRRGQRSL